MCQRLSSGILETTSDEPSQTSDAFIVIAYVVGGNSSVAVAVTFARSALVRFQAQGRHRGQRAQGLARSLALTSLLHSKVIRCVPQTAASARSSSRSRAERESESCLSRPQALLSLLPSPPPVQYDSSVCCSTIEHAIMTLTMTMTMK